MLLKSVIVLLIYYFWLHFHAGKCQLMQSIFQKENADKALKYRLYRHLPAYEKIIRKLVSFSIEKLNEMYEMIEELPDYIVECLDEFISHYGSLEEVVEHKDDIYYYPDCETMTDVAYYYIDELQALGDIPPSLQNYIDYEAYGRDLDMGGYFIETSRGMCEIPY